MRYMGDEERGMSVRMDHVVRWDQREYRAMGEREHGLEESSSTDTQVMDLWTSLPTKQNFYPFLGF